MIINQIWLPMQNRDDGCKIFQYLFYFQKVTIPIVIDYISFSRIPVLAIPFRQKPMENPYAFFSRYTFL